jgi:hypothetical protein
MLAACSHEPNPEPETEHGWPGLCTADVEAGAPTRLAWSVVQPWNTPPFYRALPDGAVVTVGLIAQSVSEETWIDVRVFEPDGSERWSDRYYGYVGYDTWVRGVRVDSNGNIYVSGLDIHGEIIDYFDGVSEVLYDELLISWSPGGERRFRSRIEPCGASGGGLGIAADGRVHAARALADMMNVCIQPYSPAGEPEPELTVDVPDHQGLLYLDTQWDGSFLITSATAESGTTILARYAPNGEQLWALRDVGLASSDYQHFVLPGLVGDGRTVVSYEEQDQSSTTTEVWMIDSEGELRWRVDGLASGVNCASEVIVRQPSGSFALHDPDDGRILHEWSAPLPAGGDHWREFIPSPDGAVYVSYRIDNADYAIARLEPEPGSD